MPNRGGLVDTGRHWPSQGGAHIDFLRCSLSESIGPAGAEGLQRLFSDHLAGSGVGVQLAPVAHYRRGYKAVCDGFKVGSYGMGAGHGRAVYELSGRGCEAVSHWGNVYQFLRGARPKLTRLDTAVDLFGGPVNLDDMLARYLRGEFDRRGRHPDHSMLGPWGEPSPLGRSLYIRGGSWEICSYEKGKKDGGPEDWLRVEVRTFSEAELSLDAMLDPDRHWRTYAGPYAHLVAAGASVQRLKQERADVSLERRAQYAKLAAGSFVSLAIANGITPDQLCAWFIGDDPGQVLGDSDRALLRRLIGLA